MRCSRCGSEMLYGEERKHLDQTLCEDCYMEALWPVRTCDPWAVHSAKSFAKHADGAEALTPIQSKILRILKETGGIEPQVLLLILDAELTPKQLEREFATLRHMEKVRGEKRGDRIFWRLWQGGC
jgi:DNA-directed RNA polymerase subunit RPC12/RpoP